MLPFSKRPGPVSNYNFNKTYASDVKSTKKTIVDFLRKEPLEPDYTLRNVTNNNPFMNVPQTAFDAPQQYTDYDRYLNHNDFNVSENLNKVFNDMPMDPAAVVYNHDNSQREFYSVPVGSVPNNQEAFAYWLYGTPGNCKAGSIWSRTGVAYTDDSLLCTGYNAAEPTNFGHLNN